MSLGAAAVIGIAEVPRYALSWVAVLLFAIAVDAVVRRSEAGTLEAAARQHPRLIAAATGVLGLAAWVRLEYASLGLIWALVVVIALRRRPGGRAVVLVLPPLAVAAVAHVAVIVAGGLQHYWWWGHYALVGFREFRAAPRNWDIPFDYISALVHGRDAGDLRLQMASYFAGGVLVLVAAASLALRRRGFIRRDPSLLPQFLVAAGAVVLYAQSVRFFGGNGISAMPVLLTGFLALAYAGARWVRLGIVALLLLVTWPVVQARFDVPHQLSAVRDAWRANGRHESVEHLRRMPLTAEERASLPVILDLWRRRPGPPHTDRIAVVNRRNDDAQANEAFLYWFLDARPAVWPVTYDPGLADAPAVRAEELRDLCRHRPAVVQFVASYAKPWGDGRDRRLDPFIALNHHLAGESDMHRLLVPNGTRCVLPQDVPITRLHEARDVLLARGDRPAAGALAVEAVQRPGRADPEDAALAVLSEYRIDPADMPPGAAGRVVRAIQDGASTPSIAVVATDRAQPPLVRVAAMQAFVARQSAFTDADKQKILAASWQLLRARPDIPDLAGVLMSFQPPAEPVFAALTRIGVRAPWLARWRFSTHASANDPRAIAEGRALLTTYARQPQEQARVLHAMAQVFSAMGDAACSAAALAAEDRIPGADPGPYEGVAASCPALPAGR